MESMNVFISQPMAGKDKASIEYRAHNILKMLGWEGKVELIDQWSYENENRIRCLAHSIDMMRTADVVIFTEDSKTARGCRIEYSICKEYGIPFTVITNVMLEDRVQKEYEQRCNEENNAQITLHDYDLTGGDI